MVKGHRKVWAVSGWLLLTLACLYFCLRIFVCDSFIVRGPSMEPNYHDGERVLAFKIGCGARIYTNYDFTEPRLGAFRLPGLRPIRKGDVVVFNHPYGVSEDSISFKINYVLIKRCAGAPGDSVSLTGREPIYVPRKGDAVRLDSTALRKYRPQIMYETDGRPAEGDEYTFKSNWYYFLGDNASLSLDSRVFGLVPESYIVGRVG